MQINKEYFIKVPNEMLGRGKDTNWKISSMSVTLYMLLYKDLNIRGLCKFSIKDLMEQMGIRNTESRQINQLKDSLEELKKLEVFKYIDISRKELDINNINNNKFIYAELLIDISENFTVIYDDEINTMLSYSNNNKLRKYDFIRAYVYLISFIYENDRQDSKYSYFTHKKMITDLESSNQTISSKTIIEYKNIYNDLELLYVNTDTYRIVDGRYKYEKSCHCRYEYKNILEEVIKQQSKDNDIKLLDTKQMKNINNKRSVKAKINNILKKKNRTYEENIRLEELEKEYNKLTK